MYYFLNKTKIKQKKQVGHTGIRTRVSAFKVLRAKPLHYTALTTHYLWWGSNPQSSG